MEISQLRSGWLKSENDLRPERTMETGVMKCSTVLSGRDDFADALPATMWLANFRLSLRDEAERRQARHGCSSQNQTRFQASFGGRAQAPE